MARIPINQLGSIGVVRDIVNQFLPPQAWTNANNMRMRGDGAVRISGDIQVFDTPSVAPKWAMGVPGISNEYFWLYSDGAAVHCYNGTAHADITQAATTYGATDVDLWTGTLLGGIPILNNDNDVPQYWPTLDNTVKLADVTAWPAGVSAKAIRAFGPYLLALNITKAGSNFPNMVKWSHPADPGALPISWDHTDETKDAGEVELTDVYAGGLVDGIPIGNVFVVYKENSAHILRYSNSRFVFQRDPLFPTTGILSLHCVAEIPVKGQVFLATGEDIVVHGLQRGEIQSLLDNRNRRTLNADIDTVNIKRSFCVSNEREKEMWFCYPEIGETWPTKALIWNYTDNTITFRDLEEVSFITNGIIQTAETVDWDSMVGNWDADPDTWSANLLGAASQNMLMCLPEVTQMRKVDTGDDFTGMDIDAFIERTDLAVIGVDRRGQPMVDVGVIKLINRVWVKARGAPFNVQVGAQEEEGGVIVWSSEELFTPGVDRFVDFFEPVSGRFIAIRFLSLGGLEWKVEGYDLDLEVLGTF